MPPAEDPSFKIQHPKNIQIPSSITGTLEPGATGCEFRTRCFPGTAGWSLESVPCHVSMTVLTIWTALLNLRV